MYTIYMCAHTFTYKRVVYSEDETRMMAFTHLTNQIIQRVSTPPLSPPSVYTLESNSNESKFIFLCTHTYIHTNTHMHIHKITLFFFFWIFICTHTRSPSVIYSARNFQRFVSRVIVDDEYWCEFYGIFCVTNKHAFISKDVCKKNIKKTVKNKTI